ncbi:MAG: hypothetical protein ABW092_00930 [Candidatus Thiodiazotropha sp.]
MNYEDWFEKHGEKHRRIVDKLKSNKLSRIEIVKYFDYENMVVHEPEFCFLYTDNKKCHEVEKLNCYLCACPLFRFNDNGFYKINNKTVFSQCEVNSKHGVQGEFGEAIHLDCSRCTVPHAEKYVLKNYDDNWFAIMEDCNQGD